MTADEYFDWHIPHRLTLLVAFRTRYSGDNSSRSLDPETYRDLFRCAKDMSLLMTRFFCGELGMYCDEATHEIKSAQKWTSRFRGTRVDVSQVTTHQHYRDLCQMYEAANQAVAHVGDRGVSHSFEHSVDDQRMVAVITWLEALVRDHIYHDAGRDLARSMSLPQNVM